MVDVENHAPKGLIAPFLGSAKGGYEPLEGGGLKWCIRHGANKPRGCRDPLAHLGDGHTSKHADDEFVVQSSLHTCFCQEFSCHVRLTAIGHDR